MLTNRRFHGLERSARTFSGARGVWVIHPAGQIIGEHRHDWPFLMLPALGDCLERNDNGEARIAGPSAVLHPAGTCHANCIGARGLETVSIEFDPDWMRFASVDLAMRRSQSWVGGPVGAAARALAVEWNDVSKSETDVARATAAFLRLALTHEARVQPRWLGDVLTLLDDKPPATAEIARRLDLHPAWLARSYRTARGEGLHETVRRKRVERAVMLLRGSDAPPTDIALTSGFCDQSHMNRSFKAVLGRTPLQVRAERTMLAGFE